MKMCPKVFKLNLIKDVTYFDFGFSKKGYKLQFKSKVMKSIYQMIYMNFTWYSKVFLARTLDLCNSFQLQLIYWVEQKLHG